jgi:hypothetical protein
VARKQDILAMSMAQAILAACGRVTGASLHNAADESGVAEDGTIRLISASVGARQDVWLDMDFIPDATALPIGLRWQSDSAPGGQVSPIGDLVNLRLDGRPVVSPAGKIGGNPRAVTPPADSELPGFSVDLAGALSLEPGRVHSLRVSLSDPDGSGAELRMSSESAAAAKTPNYEAVDDATTITRVGVTTLNLTANDIGPGQSGIYVTAINGISLEPGESVTLSGGQVVTLLDDGTVSIVSNGNFDSFSFTYTATFGKGNAKKFSDVATVTVDTVPCFVAGTMIRTASGAVPVERLAIGDLIHTRDGGLQPIRWIGRRRIAADGPFAPIRIARDAFGTHDTLYVSPLHRILVRNAGAQLLYGTHEVLASARDLVDDRRITRVEGGHVEYVHLMFDRHQIIWSDGLETESFLLGPQTAHCYEADIVAEIAAIFPELDVTTGAGYGPTARPALRAREARLLVA